MHIGTRPIARREDLFKLLNAALRHEWAVSIEYLVHAYSMPKGAHIYDDPVLRRRTDVRAQTIQIAIDEMYHSLQLGTVLVKMGGEPSFRTDDVVRYPRIIDNLRRDKATEDRIAALYQNSLIRDGLYPEVRNMNLNISADEVRHAGQFEAMIEAMEAGGCAESRMTPADPAVDARPETALLHAVMARENALMHRYLHATILFSGHQDLSQRLFKNSIDHMRHWDKNAGLLVRMGTVMRLENAAADTSGMEVSRRPMPAAYPGRSRLAALAPLLPAERALIAAYGKLIPMVAPEFRAQLETQLALKREHIFTQLWLLQNARSVPGLK
jgi:bacterioferritin (cytochrome b1)